MTNKIIETEITAKMLTTDIELASGGTINGLSHDIKWMHLYLTYLEEDYGVKVDPVERFGVSPEVVLEDIKLRIEKAEKTLAEVQSGESEYPQRALIDAHNSLVEGRQRASEVSRKIINLYWELAEENNIEI
jgi:adenylate kinase family enzyme